MTRTSYIAGALVALTGILLSPDAVIEFLRGVPLAQLDADLQGPLQLGVQLFRTCLVLLGLTIAIIASLPGWANTGNATALNAPDTRDRLPLLVLVLAAIATAIRFYRLDTGLWVDEIMTYVNYANQPFGVLVSTHDSLNHHILYSLFTHAAFLLFGESNWSLRLPAALFGVGSILALYVFAREFVTRREAVLSAALLAFSYHHVWFSQNARGYTALLFFALLSGWMLVRALRERHLHLWVGYAVFVALGVYVHITMLFMVIGHFMIFVWHRCSANTRPWRESAGEFLAGFILAGLLTLVLYSLVLPQLIGGTYLEGANDTIEEWTNPLWTLMELVRGLQIGFTGSIAAALACIIFLAGLYRFYRDEPLVALLLVVPATVTIGVIVLLGHPMFPRTFFFLMGFGVMIAIRGTLTIVAALVRATGLQLRDPDLPGTLMCIAMTGISALSLPAVYAPKQDYSSALEYVEQNSGTGDAIATAGVAAIPYTRFYEVDWHVIGTPEELDTLRSGHKRTWLLYTMPLHMQSAHTELMTIIESDFTVVEQFPGTLGGGTVFVVVSGQPPT